MEEIVGCVDTLTPSDVTAWAIRRDGHGDRAIDVDLYVDDYFFGTFPANMHRQDLINQAVTDVGFCGFRIPHAFPIGSEIKLRDRETNRLLPGASIVKGDHKNLDAALLCVARGERKFFLEWYCHHKAQGFGTIYVGDNGGDDETSALLSAMASKDLLVRLDYVGRSNFQIDAYRREVPLIAASRQHDILGVIDCDEFLVSSSPAGAKSAVEDLFRDDRTSAVALNWAIYGSAGREEHDDGRLVIDQYNRRADMQFHANRHAKAVFRLDRYQDIPSPHAVRVTKGRYLDVEGRPVVWDTTVAPSGVSANVVWGDVRLNHYVTKSRSEFHKRKMLGPAACSFEGGERRRALAYFNAHDRNENVEDFSRAYLEKIRRNVEDLEEILQSRRLYSAA